MEQDLISKEDVINMVRHWLHTPIGTYVGSSYGFDKHALLFEPLASMSGVDEVIDKLIADVPILSILPPESINIFSMPVPPDKRIIILQIGEVTFNIE